MLRIISGDSKGRKLSSFNHNHIRPTSDMVKEGVFSAMQFDVAGSVFLDLFGGTGSVGLEAVSRGAKQVYICDVNKASIKVINENNNLLGNRAIVVHNHFKNALKDFADGGIRFDIVFLDPPYNTELGVQAIKLLKEYDLLQDNGFVVLETDKNKKINLPEYCSVFNEKRYGIKKVYFISFSDLENKESENDKNH